MKTVTREDTIELRKNFDKYTEIARRKKIKSVKTVEELADFIKNAGQLENVGILSYQLISKEKDKIK